MIFYATFKVIQKTYKEICMYFATVFNKKNLQLAVVMASTLVFSGCLDKLFSGGKKDEHLYVVNLLDKKIHDDCHIPGSVLMPFSEIEHISRPWNKSAKIVVYCSNYACTASSHVAGKLAKLGFENVYDYEEGIAGWYQAHLKDPEAYPVAGPCKESYLTAENEPIEGMNSHKGFEMISTQELRRLLEEENFFKK